MSEIGSRCDVCGNHKRPGNPCGDCGDVLSVLERASIPPHILMDWIRDVARKAAEEAVLQHENEEEHP